MNAKGRERESGPSHRPAIALYLLAALLLAWPWASGTVTIPWDAKAHFYPQLLFLSHALHEGDSPFWNPYIFAGHPQIADPQSLIFSPPFLLLAALVKDPSFALADTTLLATLATGGLALMFYARDQHWHPAGGLAAGLAFAFGGSAAWRIQHAGQILSLSFLAIAFWLLARALERRSGWYGVLAGLAAALMVLGRDQVAWLGVLLLAGFALWQVAGMGRACLGAAKPLLAGLACGTLVCAVPLALTIGLAQISNRAEIDFEGAARGSLHPASLLTALVPDLYGTDGPFKDFWGPPSFAWGPTDLFLARNMGDVYAGALPLLAVLALVFASGLWRERTVRFLCLALAALLVYALGRYTPLFRQMFYLPGADLFRRPADATFPIGMIFALLGGYAVHRWCTAPQRLLAGPQALALGLLVALVFAGAALLAVAKGTFGLAWPHILLSIGFAGAAGLALAILRRWPGAALALVASFTTLDLAINNGPNESTALPPKMFEVLRPDSDNTTLTFLRGNVVDNGTRRDRVELAAIDFHWPNLGMIHRLEHTLGYNPVRLAWFADATGAGDHVAIPDQRQFSPLFSRYRSPLADMLGLRFVTTGVPVEQLDHQFRPGDLEFIARTRDAWIYENPRALPRVVLAGTAVAADFAGLVKTGDWPEVDYRETMLLEAPAPGPASTPAKGTATISSYRNTEVVVTADAPDGGWVVLFDTWHPGWFATVDGKPAPVLRANVMFRAVAVPPGQHEVRFSFRPLDGLARQWGLAFSQ